MIDVIPPDVPQVVVEFAKEYHPPTKYTIGQEFKYVTIIDGEELYAFRNMYDKKYPPTQYIPVLYNCKTVRKASSLDEFWTMRGKIIHHLYGDNVGQSHLCKENGSKKWIIYHQIFPHR